MTALSPLWICTNIEYINIILTTHTIFPLPRQSITRVQYWSLFLSCCTSNYNLELCESVREYGKSRPRVAGAEAGKGSRVNHSNRNAASFSHYVCTKNNKSNKAIERGNWPTITRSVSSRRRRKMWRRTERSRKGTKVEAAQGQLRIGVGHVIDIHAWSGQSAGSQCMEAGWWWVWQVVDWVAALFLRCCCCQQLPQPAPALLNYLYTRRTILPYEFINVVVVIERCCCFWLLLLLFVVLTPHRCRCCCFCCCLHSCFPSALLAS